jgi:uncharacterized protein YkuJ
MYDIDTFVNSNFANVDFSASDENFDVLEALFTKKFKFDNINIQAMPVLVYELNGNAVAWYDEEMQMGFIA